MIDPYVYPGTEILKNLADIQDEEILSSMEANYTSSRLADIIIDDTVGRFDFYELCRMHYEIFQDIYAWAGKVRINNIEKPEPALGGISIEYSDCFDIERHANIVLAEMNRYRWKQSELKEVSIMFSKYMAELWKIHSFREGNTRTVVTFCGRFIESTGWYIDMSLFMENASYVRAALVASSAEFHDLGDRRKPEYLEKIVEESLVLGEKMKRRIITKIKDLKFSATEKQIRKIVYWDRAEKREHSSQEIKEFIKKQKNQELSR